MMTIIAIAIVILAALSVAVAGFKNYTPGRGNVPEYFAVHDGELEWVSVAESEGATR